MVIIFRLLLTLSSLLLSVSVFLVAKGYLLSSLDLTYTNNLKTIPSMLFYFFVVLLISLVTILMLYFIDSEEFKEDGFSFVEIANDSFLPSYLGYFFVSLSAASMGDNSLSSFVFVFFIMAIFIFFSRISFFNPLFFLLGFNFYFATTKNNVKVILISRKKIKKPDEFFSDKVKRINDYTFIDME